MKATEARLLDVIRKSQQFIIPIYQRTYSWTEHECRQLWDDIVGSGKDPGISAHFVGSVVYIEKGLYHVSSQIPLLVIDGQQRLTTATLLIAAVAQHLDTLPEANREPEDGFSPRKLRNYYLVNPEEKEERYYKLVLSQTDRDTLFAIVHDKPLPREPSIAIGNAYSLFQSLLKSADIAAVCRGLAKLLIVDIALTRGQDNPQLIFESMNSTGLALTQTDLIRNFILMDLDPDLQSRLYNDYWRPMEEKFGQKDYSEYFDAFIRHYLTFRTREIPIESKVYEEFKKYARSGGIVEKGTEALVADIRKFADYYCAIALDAEADPGLRRAFQDFKELKADPIYPFLLELYDDYRSGALTRDDLLATVRLLESYVFRRAACSLATHSYRKTFATFSKSISKSRYLESIQAQLLLLPSARRFPNDQEFIAAIQTRDMYNMGSRNRDYWLRKLENDARKEPVSVREYTIEHILPQNEKLSEEWKSALGSGWKTVQETWLHTLGNLTLTGYNSEYSDRPFVEKRDMPGGFRDSPLKLNEGLGQLTTWNEQSIRERAQRLADLAVRVWAAPVLMLETLDAYKPAPQGRSYGIADHPNLTGGLIKPLFEALRKEIFSLDSHIREEFWKTVVAYKLRTNFVDVEPQKNTFKALP